MRLNMEYQMLWRGSGGRNNVNSNHMGGLVIGVCVWANLGDSFIDRMSCRGGPFPHTQQTSSHFVTTATELKDAHKNTATL